MTQYVMIDIETTGLDHKKDDILQVGILPFYYDVEVGFYRPQKGLEITLPSRKTPADGFAKEHMSELYAECNELAASISVTEELYDVESVRAKLLDFVSHLGVETKQIVSSGMNHTNFDFQFLAAKGLLFPSDFHYRSLEINSILMYSTETMLNKEGAKRTPKEVQTDAGNCSDYKGWVPELFSDDLVWKNHRALSDCYWQLRVVGGLTWFLRGAKP